MTDDGPYADRSALPHSDAAAPGPVSWSTTPVTSSWAPTGSAGQAGPTDWSVERPSIGVVIAAVGAVLVLLGFFALNWAPNNDFFDIRRAVDATSGQFTVVTQLYTKVMFAPLLLITIVVGILASVGRRSARAVTAAAGLLGGIALIGAVVWVERGGIGTDASRHEAVPALVLMVAGGVLSAALGAGVLFERRATLARGLAVGLAGVAAVLHLYVVADLFQGSIDPSFGAWVSAIGYALLAAAPVVPYRRVLHA
jgi:hypothetical protein